MGYGCRGCGEDDAKCRRDECKACCYCDRPLIERSPEMPENEKTLRMLLWLRHGCSIGTLYGDDGEMQCPCGIDFKRMDPKEIQKAWRTKAQVILDNYREELPETD